MIKKLPLRTKLIIGFLILACLTLLTGLSGTKSVNRLRSIITDISEVMIANLNTLSEIRENQSAVILAEQSLIYTNISKEKAQEEFQIIENSVEGIEASIREFKTESLSSDELEAWNNYIEDWNAVTAENHGFIQSLKDYYQSGNKKMLERAINNELGSLSKHVDNLNEHLTQLINLNRSINDKKRINGENFSKIASITAYSAMFINVILAILFGLLFGFSITKPIKSVINNLGEAAQQIAGASEQLSATGQQLAESNAELASSIQETSSTLEQSSSMISKNTENTNQAAQLAAKSKDMADQGYAAMNDMQSSMNEIKTSSDEMAQIIKVIDEIAFQTNILALNAAVEAARAGEAGMGFAVVADEVRNLAQRSAQAAKDTAEKIEKNINFAKQGVLSSQKISDSLSKITKHAKEVDELMGEIFAASQEQSFGISNISKSIVQMDKVTQTNASNAEESASSAEELSAQAINMRDIVQQMVKLINGSDTAFIEPQVTINRKTNNMYGGGSKRFSREDNYGNVQIKKTSYINPNDVIPLDEDKLDF